MQNYIVNTPVRGLRRADGVKSAIGVGEVISLPANHPALSLLNLAAIAPTDADETCPLDHISIFAQSSGQIADALSATPFSPIAVVAVTDRHALVAAIEELGGLVFFVGEGLPDQAENVLHDFPNKLLLEELDARLAEGRIAPMLLGLPRHEAEEAAPPVAEAEPAAERTKPVRKPKTPVK